MTSSIITLNDPLDNKFSTFISVCEKLRQTEAYTDKMDLLRNFFKYGYTKTGFKGDLKIWCRFLIPTIFKKNYKMGNLRLIKTYTKLLNVNRDVMMTHLESGNLVETICYFFKESSLFDPSIESTFNLYDIDNFLNGFISVRKERDQLVHFQNFIPKCTLNDFNMILCLIRGKLGIQLGAKRIFDTIHPAAYNMFRTACDLDSVLMRVQSLKTTSQQGEHNTFTESTNITVMTPILPMLMGRCNTVGKIMTLCPTGAWAELIYDGERVQIHKKGDEFRYFSTSLKPVKTYKVAQLQYFLTAAFPKATTYILDAEIVMIDNTTGKISPFLKLQQYEEVSIAVVILDCILYNDVILVDRPIEQRRDILESNMIEVPNRVWVSQRCHIRTFLELNTVLVRVIQAGLNGLVIKKSASLYEPGARGWLKLKKDHVWQGIMADTVNLVVLGAWYGKGRKGGLLSVFLMGCYDPNTDLWFTVTKVHTGLDQGTLMGLQNAFTSSMIKISRAPDRIPNWLVCRDEMVPDFVAKDPKVQPVWEITGTNFIKSKIHTANGISIRYPRITKRWINMEWPTTTTLPELESFYNIPNNVPEFIDSSIRN